MTEPVLLAEGVRKTYGVGTEVEAEVLHGVELRVGGGEFVALMGPSGSGKSTLLNLLGLLEPPTAGRVVVAGRDAGGLPEGEVTRLRGGSIGFVFQFHHLLPGFTARENVMLPLILRRGRREAGMAERAEELLAAVGLGGMGARRPGRLSGGQQQRVAIARALALSPPLLLADEPTGNLDTGTADEVWALLRRASREQGMGVLVVTHDPRLARRCDRVLELVDGRITGEMRGEELAPVC